MLINFLWIAGFWLGIGLLVGLGLWLFMATTRRLRSRAPSAVRQLPEPVPEAPRAPFRVLAGGGGGPKPMRLATKAVDPRLAQSRLISMPGSRH